MVGKKRGLGISGLRAGGTIYRWSGWKCFQNNLENRIWVFEKTTVTYSWVYWGGGHSHLKGYWVYELLNRWVLEQRWVFYGGSHQKYGQLYKDVRELSKVKSTKKGNIMALVLWICKLRSECIITRWPLFHYMHFSISMFSFCPYASFLVFWHFFNSFTFLSFNLPLR